jgi:F0F1-type ATP synthase membrane subunit b/b'
VNYIYSTYDSFKFFAEEHLIVPLKTIYASTFESRASASAFENSQLNYTNSKKILEEMLGEYGRQHAAALAQINDIPVEEFLKTLNQRAVDEDMNIVMKYYQQELNAPIRSALVGDLIKGKPI